MSPSILDRRASVDSNSPIAKLSSSLSHELRNPLSSVKMAVQTVAQSTALSERDRKRLSIANREIRTIERMLVLLSEYGRDAPLALESVSLVELVREAILLVELETADREIRFRIERRLPMPNVRVDPGRLRPVLAQLFLNVAMGIDDEGELPIWIGAAEGGCSLRVEDRTAQLPPGERERLFEPFGSFLARGAGLSMAVLHRLVRLHGGNVTAQEHSPAGVEYTLIFPA